MAHKVELVIKSQYKKLLLLSKTQPEWVHDLFRDQIEQITLQSSDDEEYIEKENQVTSQSSNGVEDADNEEKIFQLDTQNKEDKEDTDNEGQIVEMYVQNEQDIEDADIKLQIDLPNKDNKDDTANGMAQKDVQCNVKTENADDEDMQQEENKKENEEEIAIIEVQSKNERKDVDNDEQIIEVVDVQNADEDEHVNKTELQSFEAHNEYPIIDTLFQTCSEIVTEIDQTSNIYFKLELGETSTEIDIESAQELHNSDKLNVVLVQSEVVNTVEYKKSELLPITNESNDVRIFNIDSNMNERNTDQCLICKSRSANLTNHYIRMHRTESYVSRLTEEILTEMRNNVFLARPLYEEKVTSKNFKTIKFAMRCPFCDLRIIDFFINYYNHFSTHTGEFAYCCNYCKLKKPYYGEMLEHKNRSRNCIKTGISTHYVYRDDQTVIHIFQCKLCNFVQLNSANAYKHIMEHHGTNYNEYNIEKLVIAAISVIDIHT